MDRDSRPHPLENPNTQYDQTPGNGEVTADKLQQDVYGGRLHGSVFHGLDLGVFKIGFEDNSFDLGVNIFVARAEVRAGQETGGMVGAGIDGLASGQVGGGIAFDGNGIHAGGAANADALNTAGGSARAGAELGSYTGAQGDVRAYVGPANAGVGAGAGLGADGLNGGAGAHVAVDNVASLHADGLASLSPDSQVSAGLGGSLGDGHAGAQAGIYSDRNQDIRPGMSGYAYNAESQPYPQLQGQTGGPGIAQPSEVQGQPVAEPVTVEAAPLAPPPVSPENFSLVEKQAREQVIEQQTVIAKKGQTYLDILLETHQGINPATGAAWTASDLQSEVPYIEQINHQKPIRAGEKISTMSATEIDWQTRVLIAQKMGWPAPQG